jgi:putative addiction module component (TIGR02574 family)
MLPSELAFLQMLPAQEKLLLVEQLWDDLGEQATPIPLPDWIDQEVSRRDVELNSNPTLAVSHEEMWERIKNSASYNFSDYKYFER